MARLSVNDRLKIHNAELKLALMALIVRAEGRVELSQDEVNGALDYEMKSLPIIDGNTRSTTKVVLTTHKISGLH